MVNAYIENPTLEQDAQEKKIFKLITDDVNRTLPESTLFRHDAVQKLMRKYLYPYLEYYMFGICAILQAATFKESTIL